MIKRQEHKNKKAAKAFEVSEAKRYAKEQSSKNKLNAKESAAKKARASEISTKHSVGQQFFHFLSQVVPRCISSHTFTHIYTHSHTFTSCA